MGATRKRLPSARSQECRSRDPSNFFHSRRYSSFHRQLNLWGFTRLAGSKKQQEGGRHYKARRREQKHQQPAMMVRFPTITRCFIAARLSFAKAFVVAFAVAFAFRPSISSVQSSVNSPSTTQEWHLTTSPAAAP